MAGGHAWQILRDTFNERAVCILLECILVFENKEDTYTDISDFSMTSWQMTVCIEIDSALNSFQIIFIRSCPKMPMFSTLSFTGQLD